MTSQTRTRTFRDTSAQAAAAAHIKAQNTTCEGCVWLQKQPRPQCKGEASDFFRMVRDTHYPRCAAYEVRRKGEPGPVKPEAAPVAKPKRMRLVEVRGTNRVVSEAEYDRLLNAGRKRA